MATEGLLRRWGRSLVQSAQQRDDEELQADTEAVGATRICDLPERHIVDVCGTVRAVTLPPKAKVPMFVVELYDGTRPLHLVWLGRRAIRGIEPGSHLTAHGRVTKVNGIPTIFNPTYALKPTRHA